MCHSDLKKKREPNFRIEKFYIRAKFTNYINNKFNNFFINLYYKKL